MAGPFDSAGSGPIWSETEPGGTLGSAPPRGPEFLDWQREQNPAPDSSAGASPKDWNDQTRFPFHPPNAESPEPSSGDPAGLFALR